jgi:hypothetical protein
MPTLQQQFKDAEDSGSSTLNMGSASQRELCEVDFTWQVRTENPQMGKR